MKPSSETKEPTQPEHPQADKGAAADLDMWKYFGITHTDHVVMNPTSLAKNREVVEVLRLPAGARVLDVACGKAEFLCLVAERYDVAATGVDLSPFTIEAARENVAGRGLAERIELLQMDGSAYQPEAGSLDLAACIGGSWVFQGHRGTLEALMKLARPGGLVLVGEPFWIGEPPPEYLAATGTEREMCGSHADNAAVGLELGLSLLYTVVSNQDDWDRYEGLQWQAAQRYAAAHPDDPDVEALLERSGEGRDAYLRWGRDCMGWAIYLFRKP